MAGRMQNPALRPAYGYVRVSRVGAREGDSFLSPELQAEKVARLAAEHGYRIVETFEDLDESGGKWNRPAFQRARSGLLDGRAVALVAATQSRIARSTRDLLRTQDELTDVGARLIVGDLDVPDDGNGRMMRTIVAAMDEGYRSRSREQFAEAKAKAVANGKYISKTPPLGYDRTEDGRLTPNAFAPAVRDAFLLAARGASRTELVELIAAKTERRLDVRSIGGILRNRAYIGYSVHGEFVNESAHEPIVTPEEFAAAQPRPGKLRRQPRAKSLLAGIARCASCGRKMGSTTSGTGIRTYRCPRNSGSAEPCPAPATIKEEWLDVYVIEAVRSWARAEGLEDDPIEVADPERELGASIERLQRAEAERDAYAVETAGLGIPARTIALGLAAREEAVREAQEAVDAARDADGAAAAKTTLRELWPTLANVDRRFLIGSVVERVAVSPRRVPGEPVGSRARIIWR